jgi:hypothetical protein
MTLDQLKKKQALLNAQINEVNSKIKSEEEKSGGVTIVKILNTLKKNKSILNVSYIEHGVEGNISLKDSIKFFTKIDHYFPPIRGEVDGLKLQITYSDNNRINFRIIMSHQDISAANMKKIRDFFAKYNIKVNIKAIMDIYAQNLRQSRRFARQITGITGGEIEDMPEPATNVAYEDDNIIINALEDVST